MVLIKMEFVDFITRKAEVRPAAPGAQRVS